METYPGITPAIFWDLDDDEYASLKKHLIKRGKQAEAEQKAAEAMRKRIASRRRG